MDAITDPIADEWSNDMFRRLPVKECSLLVVGRFGYDVGARSFLLFVVSSLLLVWRWRLTGPLADEPLASPLPRRPRSVSVGSGFTGAVPKLLTSYECG